jgi:hypothetical protein
MNESQAIDSAYSAEIQNLFKVLSASFLTAKGNAAEEKKAEAAFKLGLDLSRKVYGRAKELMK